MLGLWSILLWCSLYLGPACQLDTHRLGNTEPHEPAVEELVPDVSEESSSKTGSPKPSLRNQPVNATTPRVPVGNSVRPKPAQVGAALLGRLFTALVPFKPVRGSTTGQRFLAPRDYLDRESHYIWGKRYLLQVVEEHPEPKVVLKHSRMILRVGSGTNCETRQVIVAQWYPRTDQGRRT